MARTLQQIRNDFRLLIGQQTTSTSDFTDAEVNGLANEAQEYLAVRAEYPRDIVSVQAEQDKGVYNLPTDTLNLKQAYFGDKDTSGDIKNLVILTEEGLSERRPDWLGEVGGDSGEPDTVMLLNRTQVFLSPPPNADNSATGKKLWLSYIYYPAAMSADGDSPDLPDVYQHLLKFRMATLAYLGKLNNPGAAASMEQFLEKELAKVKAPATREIANQGFYWVGADADGDSYNGGIDV